MALNQSDASNIEYKAKISWYRERVMSLSQGFVNPSSPQEKMTPSKYLSNLDDLKKKADKLNKRIDDTSAGLRIPVDKTNDHDVSVAVATVDPESGGEYVTYELYKRLAEQVNAGVSSIKVEDIVSNSSNDPTANSQLIQNSIYSGYASYDGRSNSLIDDAISYWNSYDYDIRQILNFCDGYLGTFPSPEYEPWAFKGDVMIERSQIDGFRGLWNGYSEAGRKDLEQFDGMFKDLVELKPDRDIAGVTERYIDYTNRFLNSLNDLLGTQWTADLICCFMKYIVKLDPKTLKAFLTMLQFLKSGMNLDFGDILNAFRDMFNNFMRNLIMNQLMNLILQMFSRVVEPVKRWIEGLKDGGTKVFECLPVKQLILQYLDAAVSYAENYIREMLHEWYKEHELKRLSQEMKIFHAGESKWLNQAINILNTIVRASELSANCGMNDTPQSDEVNKILDGINSPTHYSYPVEDRPNIYNSFITPEQQVAIEDGLAVGDSTIVAKVMNQADSAKVAAISSRLDDCRRNITIDDMPSPILWP
jgi:hypothetical protein